jgi:hypothetical protein
MNQRSAPQVVSTEAPASVAGSVPSSPRHRASALPASHGLAQLSVTPPVRVQAELSIGAPDDAFEREADAVADAVMRMPDPARDTPTLQRACSSCEDEQLQTMPLGGTGAGLPTLQRLGSMEEDDESLQASPIGSGVIASASGGLVASGEASAQVAAARQGGEPLSGPERAFFQPRLACDLSAVRVHSGAQAAAAAASVGARAFTVGPDIVLGAGQPGPSSPDGRRLFAHELAHVIQQGHAPALREQGDD